MVGAKDVSTRESDQLHLTQEAEENWVGLTLGVYNNSIMESPSGCMRMTLTLPESTSPMSSLEDSPCPRSSVSLHWEPSSQQKYHCKTKHNQTLATMMCLPDHDYNVSFHVFRQLLSFTF